MSMKFQKLVLKTPHPDIVAANGSMPHTLLAGDPEETPGANCKSIVRDPEGGFDVTTQDNAVCWVPNENIVGGKKIPAVVITKKKSAA